MFAHPDGAGGDVRSRDRGELGLQRHRPSAARVGGQHVGPPGTVRCPDLHLGMGAGVPGRAGEFELEEVVGLGLALPGDLAVGRVRGMSEEP